MRELAVSRRSPYIRAFIWLWGVDPQKLNICKLFWGTVFFPFGLFFHKGPILGSIPGTSLFVLILSAAYFGIGWVIPGSILLVLGLAGVFLGYRTKRGRPSIESKIDALIDSPAPWARRTRVGLGIVSSPIWVPLFLVFKLTDLVIPDRPAKQEGQEKKESVKRIRSGGVLLQGFKAFKQKTCVRVKLI